MAHKSYSIALYPGDGIGPEVTDQAVRVLECVAGLHDLSFVFERFDWGAAYHEREGCVAPEDFLLRLRPFDAIFLGAIGWPPTLADHIKSEDDGEDDEN